MANRYFEQYQYSLEKKLVHLYAKVTVGATGAPTLDAANSKGVASIVRNSAGKYTITLQDTFNKFLGATVTQLGSAIPAAPGFSVVSQAVGTLGAPTIVVQFASGTTATDVDNGMVLWFHFTLGNSSI